MPGAPNRPPEPGAPPPAVAPAAAPAVDPAHRVVRRLAPARVALRLDLWKGQVPLELFTPFDRAEQAFQAADYAGADSQLDLLAVRLAEPRWPSLPVPFRDLRVAIVQPTPPNWDPESALPPAERQVLKGRRHAESQLALATGSLAWAGGHGIDTADLTVVLETARAALVAAGPGEAFWTPLDEVWAALRGRVPAPTPAPSRRPAPVDAPVESA